MSSLEAASLSRNHSPRICAAGKTLLAEESVANLKIISAFVLPIA